MGQSATTQKLQKPTNKHILVAPFVLHPPSYPQMNIQRAQVTLCRFCRYDGNNRRSFVTKLIADWKEMLRNSEPRPDPPGMKPPVFTFRK